MCVYSGRQKYNLIISDLTKKNRRKDLAHLANPRLIYAHPHVSICIQYFRINSFSPIYCINLIIDNALFLLIFLFLHIIVSSLANFLAIKFNWKKQKENKET